MAIAQKITRDNYTTLLQRSTNARGSSPDGNVYFDTANDKIQLITAAEMANIDFGSGAEANPFTHTDKLQPLALYFFILQEVEADPTLQQFRFAMDAVGSRMGKLVGATAFLNSITLDTNTSTTNNDDRDKLCDGGFGEYNVAGTLQKIHHGVKSLVDINDTSQPFYQIVPMAGSVPTEAERMAVAPVDFANPGDINEAILTYDVAGDDNRTAALILGVRDYGYTVGEATSYGTGVAELGAYSQGYGIGNSFVSDVDAITEADVWGGAQTTPYSNLSFYRHATAQTRTGFASSGAGASGDFTDEIQLSSGTVSITQLRAWLDKFMQSDADENANTVSTGAFRPKRVAPMYTIDSATAKLVTRAGVYIDPAKLTAEAQQQIVMTNDAGGQHTIPFNAGIQITVSDAWLADTNPWFRLLYLDGAAGADFDTTSAVTVQDASSADIAGDDTDVRITSNTLSLSYAYDTNTQAGLSAGADKDVVLQIGGTDNSKSRTVSFTITRSTAIAIDASTEAETN